MNRTRNEIQPIVVNYNNRENQNINMPNDSNADYIMAEDTIETIVENGVPKEIQKTGVICPECYRDTDFVIWGIHKKKEVL